MTTATPTADSYSIASGESLYAGMLAPLPKLRRLIQFGDSLTAFSYQADPSRWGVPLTGRPPKILYNYGVPNENLQDMVARQSAALAGAAIAQAQGVLFRAGTNGAGSGDFATEYAQIVDAFIAAGLFVSCEQIPPKQGADLRPSNVIIQSICAARPTTTKYVQDSDGMGDGSYAPLAGMTVDGIHHSPLGQYTAGSAQAPILAPYFDLDPRVTDSTAAAAQWVSNPLMAGTGGSLSGGTGVVPNGMSATSIGTASFVASIIAADGGDPIQVPWLRIQLAAMNSGSSFEIRADMVHGSIAADFSAVRTVDTVAELRLVGLDSTNLGGIEVGPEFSRTFIQPAPRANLTGCGTINTTLVMRTSYERNGPSSYTANSLKAMINITAVNSFASPAGYIDVRCISAVGALN